MAFVEVHSFRKASCIDQQKKLVLPSGAINLKITCYSADEYKNLSADYKNFTFNNLMTEFEFIFETEHNNKKVELNKLYQFEIFEKNYMEGTDFFGTLLQHLRTEKLSGNKQRYFYYGIKTMAQTFDELEIFSNYLPKIFVIVGNNKSMLKKVFTQSEESDLKELFDINDYDYYEVSKYLSRYEGTHKDGALIDMSPEVY